MCGCARVGVGRARLRARPQASGRPLGSALSFIRKPFCALLALICSPLTSSAQTSLDPSVSNVVTGGYWEQGKQRGQYRIVVERRGWEHVWSSLRVEWLVEDPDKQEVRVLTSSSVDSMPDWAWSLGAPQLTCTKAGCRFTIEGTDHVDQEARWVVTLQGPGQLTAEEKK